MKKQASILLALMGVSLLTLTCSKPDIPRIVGDPNPTVIYVKGVTVPDTAIVGKPYSGNAQLEYQGGNGNAYPGGAPVASTNVTGLTATLQAGTLPATQGQKGTLTYKITGTATSAGIARFKIEFFGLTVEINIFVQTQDAYDCERSVGAMQVVCRAKELLALLNPTQLAAIQLPYTKANAVKWSPEALPCTGCHTGLQWLSAYNMASVLNGSQLYALYALIRAATGNGNNNGFSEVMTILETDTRLLPGEYYPVPANGHVFGIYYVAFLGTPSLSGTWQLQISGHNLSINNTYVNGQLASSTPSFRGAEPASWSYPNPPGPNILYQPLNDEQTGMAGMLASLTAGQLATAKLNTNFNDVLLGVDKDGLFPATKQGLPVSSLSAAQQQLVIDAIKTCVTDGEKSAADAILAQYTNELNDTYIAYSGDPAIKATGDYVRIDGPSVWIEFICKPGVSFTTKACYFTIWRDHKKDYNGL